MLQGDFFSINQQDIGEQTIESAITLNTEHPIYKGHFPDQPVVPGVCMMQMIAELTSQALEQKVALKRASQAKFLVPIIPQKHPKLTVTIKYVSNEQNELKVSGSIQEGEITFFKFKGILA